MKLIYVVLVLLLVLTASAKCQLNAEDWFSMGKTLSNQSRYDEAIQAYDKAIKLDPKK